MYTHLVAVCPECQTHFKLVRDQLKICGGWVRCGHCHAAFDASVHSYEDRQEPSVLDVVDPEVSLPDDIEIEVGSAGFLEDAKKAAFWSRKSVRISLWLLSLLALGVLTLQAIYVNRNWIHSYWPTTRFALERMCSALHCNLQPIERIASIHVEDSNFEKTGDHLYRLTLSVRNADRIALAAPALELTLTNAQDQAVIRCIFRAQEVWHQSQATLPAGQTMTVRVDFAVTSADESVLGYRVQLLGG